MRRTNVSDLPKEPTDEDLAAIEAEWLVIEAELAELDAVIRIVTATREPSELDVREYRRAQRRVLREMRRFLATQPTITTAGTDAA